MSELKPCPFCGGEATMVTALGEYWVKCATGCCHSMHATEIAASDEWNTRADSLALAAAVQAERKEIMSGLLSLRHAVERVNEVNVAHGIGIAQTIVRDRPAPAVDVIGIVREFIEAHDEWMKRRENGVPIPSRVRGDKAFAALRSLVDGAAANDKGEGR